MELYRAEATVEENGELHLEHLPFSPGERVEIIVRKPSKVHPSWPEGYFERTFGAITDPAFKRYPQGAYEERVWDEVIARIEARRGKYSTLPDTAYSTDALYD